MVNTKAQLDQLKKALLLQEGVREIEIRLENEVSVVSVATFPDRRKDVMDPALLECFVKETTRLNLVRVVLDIHDRTVDFNPPL